MPRLLGWPAVLPLTNPRPVPEPMPHSSVLTFRPGLVLNRGMEMTITFSDGSPSEHVWADDHSAAVKVASAWRTGETGPWAGYPQQRPVPPFAEATWLEGRSHGSDRGRPVVASWLRWTMDQDGNVRGASVAHDSDGNPTG